MALCGLGPGAGLALVPGRAGHPQRADRAPVLSLEQQIYPSSSLNGVFPSCLNTPTLPFPPPLPSQGLCAAPAPPGCWGGGQCLTTIPLRSPQEFLWEKEGSDAPLQLSSDSVLIFPFLNKSDSGTYVCTATSSMGSVVAKYNLDVSGKRSRAAPGVPPGFSRQLLVGTAASVLAASPCEGVHGSGEDRGGTGGFGAGQVRACSWGLACLLAEHCVPSSPGHIQPPPRPSLRCAGLLPGAKKGREQFGGVGAGTQHGPG